MYDLVKGNRVGNKKKKKKKKKKSNMSIFSLFFEYDMFR